MTKQKPITINVDVPQPDPSGSGHLAKAVDVDPEYFKIDSKLGRTLTLSVEGAHVTRITGLRYMNVSTTYAGTWYLPKPSKSGYPDYWSTEVWTVHSNPGWYDLEVDPDDPKTITVKMKKKSDVYVYVVEWEEEDHTKYVCDPKVRNEP